MAVKTQRIALASLLGLLAGCSEPCDPPADDGGATDSGATAHDSGILFRDAGTFDAGTFDAGRADASDVDAGALFPDSGSADAGSPDASLPCFIPANTWPGPQTVVAVDDESADIGNDASGLVWSALGDDVLWLVENAPSRVHRLVVDDTTGARVHDLAWASPRDLTFGGGQSAPDSEGVTVGLLGDPAIYVSSERDVNDGMVSRLSVLRYDASSNDAPLDDHTEWDLTADLAAANIVVEPNGGLEALTFIPDEALAGRLFDDHASAVYDADGYPAHYGGVFAVGIEQTGDIALYVLQQNGNAVRVALFNSGLGAIMALEADRASATLWAGCDSTCNNAYAVLSIDDGGDTAGQYRVRDVFFGPSELPALDHEAFALGARAAGQRTVYWAADGATAGEVVHQGAVSAGAVCPE